MKLIAKKPCSFGGKRFYIGDEIPVELVHDPKTQEKYGNLSIVKGNADSPGESTSSISLVIPGMDGGLNLELSPEGLQTVVNVLTGTADDAKPIIEQMTDGDALILLHATDNRKAVKNAAEDRAKALSETQEDAESAGDL